MSLPFSINPPFLLRSCSRTSQEYEPTVGFLTAMAIQLTVHDMQTGSRFTIQTYLNASLETLKAEIFRQGI